MTIRSGKLGTGIGWAVILAGPLFMTLLGAAHLYLQLPQPIPYSVDALRFLPLLPVVSAVGVIVAMPAVIPGAMGMAFLADRYAWARTAFAWTAAGTVLGLAIGLIAGRDWPPLVFALSATSAICARLCRHGVDWVEENTRLSRWERAYCR